MYNTGFIFRDPMMEMKFISHVMAMGYYVEKYFNTPAWVICGTNKTQQEFVQKWADYSWTF